MSTWKSKQNVGLPLYYKDKPQNNSSQISRVRGLWRALSKTQRLVIKGVVFFVAFYALLSRYVFPSKNSTDIWTARRNRVKDVFLESWSDYTRHGWGKDVYRPVSQQGRNMGRFPLGWIIVDSLDTLMLMNCEEELREARSWVANELNYDFDYNVNTFETTIRMLGGLLSAHYLSEDDVYLEQATKLGNKLIGAFDSGKGIPYASVNLKSGKGIPSHVDRGASSTAEATTVQLEFKYLAQLTGEELYWQKAERVMQSLNEANPQDGLVPIYIQPDTATFQGKIIRLGSRGDSYYEYLLKQYIQSREQVYLEMYLEAVAGIRKHLVRYSTPNHLMFLGELDRGIGSPLSNKMDHLVCFAGGMFALGATEGLDYETASKLSTWTEEKEQQMTMAKELTHTCYRMYHDVPGTGLSPEIVVFKTDVNGKDDFFIKNADKHNLQRPETVESLYYLYKITGDIKYREWGWEIFENWVKYTKVTTGGKDSFPRYTSLKDVTMDPPRMIDNMESFWLSETLKYLYLLFDDETDPKWDLENSVFNTEAHPFPRYSKPPFPTGWRRQGEFEGDGSKQEQEIEEPKEKPVAEQVVEPVVDVPEAKLKASQDNAAVADAIKQKGELPVAKQPVAKPLNEQADSIKEEIVAEAQV
ncbi:hypothetical protein OGAPHI_007210 [Ogataea philodendri]|uniref:alpha-1,2-Mannosidase n=1 Tax=Ogataea philodendri TaxID=1378263 RepID=A0A9P8SZM4_9ASCO|nr:uncharacterized protein OGAPHI_007210 [Ogataea philodendri]KAH3660005.1 hypothetical protein OGAPHI_007210 [Ogataea philodendri]